MTTTTMLRKGKRVPLYTEVGGFTVGDRIEAPWLRTIYEDETLAVTGTVVPTRNKEHVTVEMDDGMVRKFLPKTLINGWRAR